MKKVWFVMMLVAAGLALGAGEDTAEAAKKVKEKQPNLTVAYKNVKLVNPKMQKSANGRMRYQAEVKNLSSKGTIKKIEYTYSIHVKQTVPAVETGEAAEILVPKTVTLTAKNIKPQRTSKSVSCEGDASGNIEGMKLVKVRLYAGTALYTYDVGRKAGRLSWGTADKKAPTIRGMVGNKSYYEKEIHWTCFADRRKEYDFGAYVSAVDNRDGNVKVKVDTSRIQWEKEGVYKVLYSATDRAGNQATAWAKVRVLIPGTAEHVADSVLKGIVKKGWSDEKKAVAIYRYVQRHCSYVDNGSHGNWRTAALNGIRYQSGDCFTYYAVSRMLLSRAGVPNIMVTRYPAYTGYHHWWNLVYVRNGWYHFDTTPRKRKADFCLLTDKQVWGYSTSTFRFQTSRYIKRATKVIRAGGIQKKS